MIVKIIYNPYVKKSQIVYNGNEIENDSIRKYICNKKIQNWFEVTSEWQGIFEELKQKFGDESVYLEFWGRMIDYKEFELNFQKYQSEQISLSEPILIEDENILMNEITGFINKLEQNEKLSHDLSDEFEKINSNKFKICVIATMSSGKSTLINAMLGRDLLPSNTAACTATITTLTDNDEMEFFDVRCFDQTGKLFIEKRDVSLEELESYNENEEIKIIDLEGPIPGISTSRFNLHLIDTPGPNNSTNDDHEKLTFEMIESDDYAMVIYVMSPETIQSDDNDELLQMIAETMNKVGKKADERFLFVINKCDNLDPEDEDDTIQNVLETTKAYLKKRGIDKPNIYPVTAEIAKLIRMKQRGEKLTRKDKNEIENWLVIFDSSKPEDKEYQRLKSFEEFASVTPQVRQTLAKRLKTAKTEKNVVTEGLIHTGVSALEESIEEYLAKSVYPTKINEFITCVDKYLKFPVLTEAIDYYFNEKLKLIRQKNEVVKRVEKIIVTGKDDYVEELALIDKMRAATSYENLQNKPQDDNQIWGIFNPNDTLFIEMINSKSLILINKEFSGVNPIGLDKNKLEGMKENGLKYFGAVGLKFKILLASDLKKLDNTDLKRIIWMPHKQKNENEHRINLLAEKTDRILNFSRLICDETIAMDIIQLLDFGVKKKHPLFESEKFAEIRSANQMSRNAKFKVCVIATMSSGKSTLINALLGRDLLPSNTAACTATSTTITDEKQAVSFDAKCFDSKGNLVSEKKDVTLEVLEEFNADTAIKQIDLIGPIPGIDSDKMTLLLLDTPGPNNSTNDDHEKRITEIIHSDENTLVIYVMSPETIQSDDNNELLKSISDVMQKGGKQAEDRFLFVINKCDDLDPEDEDDAVENVIQTTKEYLIKKGIHYPNLFPVTAEIAKLIRMDNRGEKITRRDKKKVSNWINTFNSDDPGDQEFQFLLSFEKFASLSPKVRESMEKRVAFAKNQSNLEMEAMIHTGVPALEKTIEELIEKKYEKEKQLRITSVMRLLTNSHPT